MSRAVPSGEPEGASRCARLLCAALPVAPESARVCRSPLGRAPAEGAGRTVHLVSRMPSGVPAAQVRSPGARRSGRVRPPGAWAGGAEGCTGGRRAEGHREAGPDPPRPAGRAAAQVGRVPRVGGWWRGWAGAPGAGGFCPAVGVQVSDFSCVHLAPDQYTPTSRQQAGWASPTSEKETPAGRGGTREAEAGGSLQVQGRPGLHHETLSQRNLHQHAKGAPSMGVGRANSVSPSPSCGAAVTPPRGSCMSPCPQLAAPGGHRAGRERAARGRGCSGLRAHQQCRLRQVPEALPRMKAPACLSWSCADTLRKCPRRLPGGCWRELGPSRV